MPMERKSVLFLIRLQPPVQVLAIVSMFMTLKTTASWVINLEKRKYQYRYSGIKNNPDILVYKPK